MIFFATLIGGLAHAVEQGPFDAKLDAEAEIGRLLANANANADAGAGLPILLVFGANWCSDSRALGSRMQEQELAQLLRENFRVLFIDIGTWHRNLDIVERYGNPIDKGIPAVVVLDAGGRVLFTGHGELSSAESMSARAIHEFFDNLAAHGAGR